MDYIFRYIIIILLCWILYILICITNGVTITYRLDEEKISEIIPKQMRKEFEYDRQNFKYIIEE